MIKRRTFLQQFTQYAALIGIAPLAACSTTENISSMKISLAQWSLHLAFQGGELLPENFAAISSKDFGINAVEYVNGFYLEKAKDEAFWQSMRQRALDEGVSSQLIMVDAEGILGDLDDAERQKAVENHYKWVHAAKILGCHSIRVNAFGTGEKTAVKSALVDGMGKLASYAAQEDINVVIENHGLYSSDARFVVDVIKQVNLPNFGTLPDFGNWCMNAEWGGTQDNQCTDSYDPYQGLQEFMPYAKGVSAKAYGFNAQGQESTLDYSKLLKIVKDSDFDGYIGIEYEGTDLSEPDGIRATKALLEKSWAGLD